MKNIDLKYILPLIYISPRSHILLITYLEAKEPQSRQNEETQNQTNCTKHNVIEMNDQKI